MSKSKWMRKLAGVMAVSMTLSMGALTVCASSPNTTQNEAANPALEGEVLGVSRDANGADVQAVLGANRDRSPRTADNGYGVLAMMAAASLAGAGALVYDAKRRS